MRFWYFSDLSSNDDGMNSINIVCFLNYKANLSTKNMKYHLTVFRMKELSRKIIRGPQHVLKVLRKPVTMYAGPSLKLSGGYTDHLLIRQAVPKKKPPILKMETKITWTRAYKSLFVLNLTEHKINHTHKC